MKAKIGPSADRVRELLDYDPVSGELIWKLRPGNKRRNPFLGKKAGVKATNGYRCLRMDGVIYKEHRLAWLWMTGEWPTNLIDHINGVRDDNRWGNLRAATASENVGNSRAHGRSKSGFKGVCFHRGRWQATIGTNKKVVYLGRFDTAEEASAAYLVAAQDHFGDFARAV